MEDNTSDEINNSIANMPKSTSEISVYLTPSMAGIDKLSRQTTDREDILSGRDEILDIMLAEKNFDPNKEESNQDITSPIKSPISSDNINEMAPRKIEAVTPKHASDQQNEDANDDEHEEHHEDEPETEDQPQRELDAEPTPDDDDAGHGNEEEDDHEAKISGWVNLDHEGLTHDADHEDEQDDEDVFYADRLQAQMILWHNHPLSHFVERARRILRIQPEITIVGRAQTIARACTVADILKHEKIGVIEKITTDIRANPYFDDSGDVKWSNTTPIIVLRLHRGELAGSLSEYQQLKMSEIFEKFDPEMTGYVSIEIVEAMKLAEVFHATDEHNAAAKAFLSEQDGEQLDLPGFLRYAQRLISPMLKERIFKKVLSEHFGIDIARGRRSARRSRRSTYSELP